MSRRQLVAHVSRGNVLHDLGLGAAEAVVVKMKSQLHSQIVRAIEWSGYTRADLQDRLEESQPRFSDLMRGKISKFSLETLVGYAEELGLHPKMKTTGLERTETEGKKTHCGNSELRLLLGVTL